MANRCKLEGRWALILPLSLSLGCGVQTYEVETKAPDRDGDGSPASVDCNDDDPDISPTADERCDGIDNDCDLEVDEAEAIDGQTFYADLDGDGFGANQYIRIACSVPVGYVAVAGDCNDLDDDDNPEAEESCDGLDNNCNGEIDEDGAAGAPLWYLDEDGDGFGVNDSSVRSCETPEGYAEDGGDCDDSSNTVFPGASETWYDGIDGNCSGGTDFDADSDGYIAEAFGGEDCDDSATFIQPGALEVCDGYDNDCDDQTDEDGASGSTRYFLDSDRDGYGIASSTREACSRPVGYADIAGDCDDGAIDSNPGERETWYNGIDEDCDGESDFDADRDGFDSIDWSGLDCDDTDVAVTEAGTWWPDPDDDGYGDRTEDVIIDCAESAPPDYVDNGGDCDETNPAIHAGATEVADDGVDQNCDGADRLDLDRDGFVAQSLGGDDCDDDDASVHPWAWEVSTDGVDNDCDGFADGDDPDLPQSLSLTDGEYTALSFSDLEIDFCGLSWTEVWLSDNGLLTFGDGSPRRIASPAGFAAVMGTASAWSDLDPSRGGTIQWVELIDAVVVRFEDVPLFTSAATRHSFTVAIGADGRVTMDFERLDGTAFGVGWSCGEGDLVDPTDLSLAMANRPDGGDGLGQGTEGTVFEVFSPGGTTSDLEGGHLTFCGSRGTDSDNDGWSDLCGDPDDADVTIYPL